MHGAVSTREHVYRDIHPMKAPEILSAVALQARALLLNARLDLRAWPESETLPRMQWLR